MRAWYASEMREKERCTTQMPSRASSTRSERKKHVDQLHSRLKNSLRRIEPTSSMQQSDGQSASRLTNTRRSAQAEPHHSAPRHGAERKKHVSQLNGQMKHTPAIEVRARLPCQHIKRPPALVRVGTTHRTINGRIDTKAMTPHCQVVRPRWSVGASADREGGGDGRFVRHAPD